MVIHAFENNGDFTVDFIVKFGQMALNMASSQSNRLEKL